jgi:AbrB family looped-hinge helix DNA binding protein
MSTATVSPKFQIVIPKEVREAAGVRAGQKFAVFTQRGVIKLVPVRPLKEYRGFAKGISTEGIRDKSDRF